MTCQAVPAHLVLGVVATCEEDGVSGRDGAGVPVTQYNIVSAGTTTIVFNIVMVWRYLSSGRSGREQVRHPTHQISGYLGGGRLE